MSLQTQYPNAIWFDSAHTGTESGTFLEPYSSSINTAVNASTETAPVVIIKAGTHTLENGAAHLGNTYTSYAGGVTVIGDGDVTLESGASALDGYAFLYSATNVTYTFKNIKFLNNSTGAGGVSRGFMGKDSTFNLVLENCSYRVNSTSPQRGTFFGGTVTAKNCDFDSYSLFVHASTYLLDASTVNLENCTLYNVKNSFGGTISGMADQTWILDPTVNATIKNTIFYAAGSTNTTSGLANSAFSLIAFENCCVYSPDSFLDDFTASEDSGTPVLADPQFVDSANGDRRLRPSSPCINAGA